MTPLRPIENMQDVRGVHAERYPRNKTCANPSCDKPAETTHHIFGRPTGKLSASWFVYIGDTAGKDEREIAKKAIPHGIGLCGHGTDGCHGDVEAHRAWIKYEDGLFVWYDEGEGSEPGEPGMRSYDRVGPLDPQPFDWGSKKKRRRKQGAEKRQTRTKTFRFPDDVEDGRGQVEDALEQLEEILGYDPPRSEGYRLMDAVQFALMWVRDMEAAGDEGC